MATIMSTHRIKPLSNFRHYQSPVSVTEQGLAITHQLKTLITALRLSGEMLYGNESNIPEIQTRLGNSIIKTTYSLDRLINELTQYLISKNGITQLNKTKCNLYDITQKTCELLRPMIESKNLTLTISKDYDIPTILLDDSKVEQIISNITTNAIQFSPIDGIISIHISRYRNSLMTQVKDSGPGIPKSLHHKIFEAFFSINKSNSGFGLGLAIAHEFTKLHDGSLWVESSKGQGSIFSFTLPLNL